MAKKPTQTDKNNPYRLNGREWDRDKVMDYVCGEIANSSYSLELILSSAPEDMPVRRAVVGWIMEDDEIELKYTRAKEQQADYMAEEIIEISDDATNDYTAKQAKDGGEYVDFDHEHVNRSKLRCENRKWYAGKLRPKRYGDKVINTHQGVLGIADLSSKTDDELTAQINTLLASGD